MRTEITDPELALEKAIVRGDDAMYEFVFIKQTFIPYFPYWANLSAKLSIFIQKCKFFSKRKIPHPKKISILTHGECKIRRKHIHIDTSVP